MRTVIGITMAIIIALSVATLAYATKLPPIVFEKQDRFDTVVDAESGLSMMSQDGGLVIHVSDDTEVIFEDGTDARECLEEGQTLAKLLHARNLIVTYSATTHSFPPQTTPVEIVILYEVAVHPIYEFETPMTLPGM